MCIIPLSIEIALSSLDESAVTSGGPDSWESNSGNIALLISLFILWINSKLFFSIKKTGFLFNNEIFLATLINFSIGQLFFLYSLPWVTEKPT